MFVVSGFGRVVLYAAMVFQPGRRASVFLVGELLDVVSMNRLCIDRSADDFRMKSLVGRTILSAFLETNTKGGQDCPPYLLLSLGP